MKNLFERLKPELVIKLEQERLLYPCSIEVFEKALKSYYWEIDLPVRFAYNVVNLSNNNFGISQLLDCFIPKEK